MAAFPSNLQYGWQDLSDEPGTVVVASETEGGIPRYRRTRSDALDILQITVYFNTQAEENDFRLGWFRDTINGGADWFDFIDPRDGQLVQAHLQGGKLGAVSYQSKNLAYATRALKLEIIKPMWVGGAGVDA